RPALTMAPVLMMRVAALKPWRSTAAPSADAATTAGARAATMPMPETKSFMGLTFHNWTGKTGDKGRPLDELGRGDLQQLDGFEVDHTTADALRGVEVHEGLVGVGIAQNADAETVHNQVAAVEIPERDRELVRTNGLHIVVVVDR